MSCYFSFRPKIVAGFAGFLLLAGCGGSPPPPPQVFPPLDYSYLPPIVLNVSNITVQDNYVPDAGAGTLIGQDPEPPANALTTMLQHRLVANGSAGSGTATIEIASIEPAGENYLGAMTVRLDVASSDGRKTGFTEASVSVTQTAPDSDATPNQVQGVLYSITKQLMDQMNVQLQYQIQHNLGGWVSYKPLGAGAAVSTGAAPGGGIQAAPLTAPPAAPGPAMPGVPPPAPMPGYPTQGVGILGTLPINSPPPPQ